MKTLMMQFRVTEEEKALIAKCAEKADLTVSQYIRSCMLMEMMMDGELEAVKIIGRALGEKAREALRKHLSPLSRPFGSKA